MRVVINYNRNIACFFNILYEEFVILIYVISNKNLS